MPASERTTIRRRRPSNPLSSDENETSASVDDTVPIDDAEQEKIVLELRRRCIAITNRLCTGVCFVCLIASVMTVVPMVLKYANSQSKGMEWASGAKCTDAHGIQCNQRAAAGGDKIEQSPESDQRSDMWSIFAGVYTIASFLLHRHAAYIARSSKIPPRWEPTFPVRYIDKLETKRNLIVGALLGLLVQSSLVLFTRTSKDDDAAEIVIAVQLVGNFVTLIAASFAWYDSCSTLEIMREHAETQYRFKSL